MGCDATSYLPSGVKEREVEEFLRGLGYERIPKDVFTPFQYHHRPNRPELFEGTWAAITRDDKGVRVWTHTRIWRSRGDSDLHNATLRALKKRFGGGFHSDYGPNAYLHHPGAMRRDADGLCYRAFALFQANVTHVKLVADGMAVRYPETYQGIVNEFIESPAITFNHLLLSVLVSTVEDYFRSTYVALLRYSPHKANAL